jgi:hypothetical protein
LVDGARGERHAEGDHEDQVEDDRPRHGEDQGHPPGLAAEEAQPGEQQQERRDDEADRLEQHDEQGQAGQARDDARRPGRPGLVVLRRVEEQQHSRRGGQEPGHDGRPQTGAGRGELTEPHAPGREQGSRPQHQEQQGGDPAQLGPGRPGVSCGCRC